MPNGPFLQPKRQYHVHGTFLAYCGVTLLIAVGAFNSNNNLLYWLFGLSLGAMLVSGVISGQMMMALRVTREPIEPAQAGGPLIIRYTIVNRSRIMPAFALTMKEDLAGDEADEDSSKEAVGAVRSAPEAFVAHIPPRSTVTVEGVARAESRGRVRFRGHRLSSAFPFGIIRKSLYFQQEGSAIIRPAPAEVPIKAFDAQRGAGAAGENLARRHGTGDEFVALRPYAPGDAPKLIAWKASAKGGATDELLVRQTGSASPRRVWVELAVDAASTDQSRERAISLAAGAIEQARKSSLQIGLVAPAWGLATPPRAGLWHFGTLLNDLGLLGPPDNRGHGLTPPIRSDDLHLVIGDDGVRHSDEHPALLASPEGVRQ